uniref:Reverse transcriptase Ty1/copia-type domain-containing protein n=1 Tax=Megaselia scalaris TaxID=36166 RepID=T1GVG5_MEGSC
MAENENISPHFFEGVEKLLEVWFEDGPDSNHKNSPDLRKIPSYKNVFDSSSAQHNLKLYHMDVTTAYLNGILPNDVYMNIPEGVEVSGSLLQ